MCVPVADLKGESGQYPEDLYQIYIFSFLNGNKNFKTQIPVNKYLKLKHNFISQNLNLTKQKDSYFKIKIVHNEIRSGQDYFLKGILIVK